MSHPTPFEDSNQQSGLREGSPPQGPARSGFRSRKWIGLVAVLVVGIGIGMLLDRFLLPHRATGGWLWRDPIVTKENYAKIKQDMSSWEVDDILGSGVPGTEKGLIVDAQGRFKEWTRNGGDYNDVTGTIKEHDGKPKQEIRRDMVWRDGERAIIVTFLNDKVVARRNQNLDPK